MVWDFGCSTLRREVSATSESVVGALESEKAGAKGGACFIGVLTVKYHWTWFDENGKQYRSEKQ